MLIEILSEDKSGAVVVQRLAERIAENEGVDFELHVHPHRGCGSFPKDMDSAPPKFASSLLDLLPANISLAGAEFDLIEREAPEAGLRRALIALKDDYDYIILDCPPSLGMLTVNAMAASDGVIIPMQCEFFALEGLSQLMMTVRRIKKRYQPRLALTGILVTMYNGRLTLSTQVMEELRKHYGEALLTMPISRNVRLSEAPSFGKPVYYHDKNAKGAKEYLRVAEEIISRA